MAAERRRSLRKSLRSLASSAWSSRVGSVAVNVSAGSQKRHAILRFCVSGVADEEKIVGIPVQDGDEYSLHVAASLNFRLSMSRGRSKVRQI
jgi:hypothetical protein